MRKTISFAFLFLFSLSLRAGYYIEQKTKGRGKEGFTKIWLEGSSLRLETEKSISIVNYSSKTAYFVDKRRKVYYKMSLSQLREMLNRWVLMLQQMGMDLTPKMEITREKRVINGHKCTVVKMEMGSFQTMEQCFSPDVNIDFSAYRKVLELLLPKQLVGEIEKRAETLSRLGFPIYSKTTTNMMGRNMVSESYLVKYQTLTVSPSLFTVPEGYKEKPFNMPSFGKR